MLNCLEVAIATSSALSQGSVAPEEHLKASQGFGNAVSAVWETSVQAIVLFYLLFYRRVYLGFESMEVMPDHFSRLEATSLDLERIVEACCKGDQLSHSYT